MGDFNPNRRRGCQPGAMPGGGFTHKGIDDKEGKII